MVKKPNVSFIINAFKIAVQHWLLLCFIWDSRTGHTSVAMAAGWM